MLFLQDEAFLACSSATTTGEDKWVPVASSAVLEASRRVRKDHVVIESFRPESLQRISMTCLGLVLMARAINVKGIQTNGSRAMYSVTNREICSANNRV